MGDKCRDVDEIIAVVGEAPEGGCSARALGVPIFTVEDDLKLVRTALRDAVPYHHEADAGRPRVIRLHLVRDILIAV